MREADRRVARTVEDAASSTQEWLDKNAEDFVCDFCAHKIEGHFATYVLDSPINEVLSVMDESDLGTASMHSTYSEEWAACRSCDPVVAHKDPLKLADHALKNRDVTRVGQISPEMAVLVRTDLISLYREFYARNPQRRLDFRKED